jgi:hypothetical protein
VNRPQVRLRGEGNGRASLDKQENAMDEADS